MKEVKLTKLNFETDVKKTLNEFMERADAMQGVMIVGLLKDGGQWLQCSTMNGMEKAFLVQFVNSFMNNWFDFKNTFEEEK